MALVLVSLVLCPAVASATLMDGHTVRYEYFYPNLSTLLEDADNGDKLVGPGIEVSDIALDNGTMDISDTNIYVDFDPPSGSGGWSAAVFNGFVITDINGTIPDFTGVTINPETNMGGLIASHISFDADHIWVNWRHRMFYPDTVVSLDVTPEPATLSLLALGGLAVLRRRRRR